MLDFLQVFLMELERKKIEEMLELADLDPSGKTTLFDGLTGDAFSEDVTVGNNVCP